MRDINPAIWVDLRYCMRGSRLFLWAISRAGYGFDIALYAIFWDLGEMRLAFYPPPP